MRWAMGRRVACAATLAIGVVAAVALAVSGCGGTAGSSTTVSAASSLTEAFETYGSQLGGVRFSFGGSDELAAQIRAGARPDVYAAAETALPEQLYREGLVERPVPFASNRLVVAVPAGRSAIRSIGDLAKPGVTLVVGAQGVPAGDYARQSIARLPSAEGRAILRNVRSEEPDVKGIVAKLTAGAADAGFVYITDVEAAEGALRSISVPDRMQPRIAYDAAVVKGASNAQGAQRFVDGLLRGRGAADLRAAGFGPPPP